MSKALQDIIGMHDVYRTDFKAKAEEAGFPDAPFFLEFHQNKMPRTIIQSNSFRGVLYYTLLMSATGELRLVQIKESEVPKYAGWVQGR